jgi:predicted GNAT family acetyltransferase
MSTGESAPLDDVAVRDHEAAHRFEVWVGDDLAGFLKYRALDGTLHAFDHTEVEPRYEGRGLAGRLVTEALDATRKRGWTLLPYCPYVREFLGKHREYADLVPGDRKAEFGLR